MSDELYALVQFFMVSIIIGVIGYLIPPLKELFSEAKNDTVKQGERWVPRICHALQLGFAAFYIIDALFPLLDKIITAAERRIFAFIDQHFLLLVLVGLGAYLYIHYIRKPTEKLVQDDPLDKPDQRDYFRALDTLRPAAAEIDQQLRFALIDAFTDMAVNEADRILPWGRCWLMVYKIPKAAAADEINTAQVKRALQAQLVTVLQRDNPSGYAELVFPWHGVDKPILIVHDVLDRDAYAYVFIVKASREYFEDMATADSRKSRENASSHGTLFDD